jgi:hypothetical protein
MHDLGAIEVADVVAAWRRIGDGAASGRLIRNADRADA